MQPHRIPTASLMRFDTHRISAQLVNELQKGRPSLEVTSDGGDLISVSLESNETVNVYLIENALTVYEIGGIVAANTAVGIYTLFILWSDLLLPVHGARYRPSDWMTALLALYDDKIYAFDASLGENFFIFPVYFQGSGAERTIRHGEAIDATKLVGETVSINSPLIPGVWRVASFGVSQRPTDAPPFDPTISLYYRQMGLADTAGRTEVRQAYHLLARRFHPDLNTDPSATTQMQKINEAYEHILDYLKQHGSPDDD